MIEKQFKRRGDELLVRVTFSLPGALQADKIYLVGDFNDWNETSHSLVRNSDGHWVLELDLKPGRAYQFRYLSDGVNWMNDNDADAYVHNQYGNSNSVVITDPDFEKHEGV